MPKSCNAQAYHVTEALAYKFNAKGIVNDKMLEKLCLNLKLQTLALQEVKVRQIFFKEKYRS